MIRVRSVVGGMSPLDWCGAAVRRRACVGGRRRSTSRVWRCASWCSRARTARSSTSSSRCESSTASTATTRRPTQPALPRTCPHCTTTDWLIDWLIACSHTKLPICWSCQPRNIDNSSFVLWWRSHRLSITATPSISFWFVTVMADWLITAFPLCITLKLSALWSQWLQNCIRCLNMCMVCRTGLISPI